MKTITIKQPWASLIVHGIKPVENRTWRCPKKYIGQRVLIHAGATPVIMRNPNSIFAVEQWNSLSTESHRQIILGILSTSAIIGSVEIVGCVLNHPSIWAEESIDNKCPNCGRPITHNLGWESQACERCKYICKQGIHFAKPIYNWVLANPIIYEKPIENVKGKLSFWDYPGIQEVKIECPSCGSIEIAVEDHTTEPFSTFLHSCNKCGHVIMESEWNRVK